METSEKKYRAKQVGRALLDLPRRITEPSKAIVEEGNRRKARFLSALIFTTIPIFPILQITSEVTGGFPYYSGSAILLAGLYVMSRTKHIRFTSTFAIIFPASFPFLILIMNEVWTNHNLAFQLMTWPVLAAIIGSQILTKEKEALLISVVNVGLVILCLFHPGIAFLDAIKFIAASFAIQTLLWFTNWTYEYYTTKIEQSNRAIETRKNELEIYTNLLRHDLANDIQIVLGDLELAKMNADEPKRHASFLESAFAAGERMKNLIHIFSVSEDELDNDIVTVLELICNRAQIIFKDMLVTLEIEDEVRNQPVSYGKLTALAFENLLRNTAQHAGDEPNVRIKVSQVQDYLEIIFEDDGLGVPEEIRGQLFRRGVTTRAEGRGLGLYLTKTIIEAEGGSIALIDNGKPGCCFEIRLPLH